MNFKAIVTSLILSTSTAALADHDTSFSYNDRFDDYQSMRDRRAPRRPTWTPLSQEISASRRNVIHIDESRDNLAALRLQNGSGATYIYSMTLRFDDGSRETIEVGKWLYAGVPLLTFDIPQQHGGLERIVVNTWTNGPATYQVLGQRMRDFSRPPVVQPLPPLPPAPLPPVHTGVSLGSDFSFASGAGYVQIPVGVERGAFRRLSLTSLGGEMSIGRIYVTFASGAHQMFDLNKSFYRGEQIDLDLKGSAHAITAITVMAPNGRGDGDRRANGRFSVSLL
ncbi:MAG TPA: hypothetical protein VK427_21345 [Kofleriaceae bacterium]|nr:hypothetical protein [Kofleriaceae bacterium]